LRFAHGFLLRYAWLMKEKITKNPNDNELVTKNYLREELEESSSNLLRKIDESNLSIRKELEESNLTLHKKIDEGNAAIHKKFEEVVDVILAELGNMRAENREFYQMREQLYDNSAKQENRLKDHEKRIFKLELVR
jgi:hypothetical protein